MQASPNVPELTAPLIIVSILFLIWLFAFASGWVLVVAGFAANRLQIPNLEERVVPPFGLIHLFLGVGCLLVLPIFVAIPFLVGSNLKSVVQSTVFMVSNQFVLCMACLGISAVGMLMAKIRFSDTCWSVRRLHKDLICAGIAFVLFVPFVFMMNAVVTIVSNIEYTHPILDRLRDDPNQLVWLGLVAVIGAPIAEEFLFRGLLQGFLESMALGKWNPAMILLGRNRLSRTLATSPVATASSEAAPIENDDQTNLEGIVSPHSIADPLEPAAQRSEYHRAEEQESNLAIETVELDEEKGARNPYQPLAQSGDTSLNADLPISTGSQSQNQQTIERVVPKRTWWPIVVSSILFGLAHFEYGISWLPLIGLGAVLGVLYQQTGRIWACIFLHTAFNSIGIAMMAMQVYFPESFPQPDEAFTCWFLR